MSNEPIGELAQSLDALAKKYSRESDEIDKIFREEFNSIKNQSKLTEPHKVALLKTMLRVENLYGKKITFTSIPNGAEEVAEKPTRKRESELAQVEGFLISAGEYRDEKTDMKERIKKTHQEKGKRYCEDAGMMDVNGVMLDYREKAFGRTNDHKGEPLDSVDIARRMTLYGIFRRVDVNEPFMFTVLQTSNTTVADSWHKSLEFPKHSYIPVRTWVNLKDTPMGLDARATTVKDKVTRFEAIKEPPFNVHETFMTTVEPLLMNMADLGGHYAKYGDEWNRIVFIRGIVDDIRPEYAKWKGIPATLHNEKDVSESIKIHLPKGYDRDFGSASTIIIFGRDDEIMHKDPYTGKWDMPSGLIEIRVYGAYALPGLRTDPSSVSLSEFNAFVGVK